MINKSKVFAYFDRHHGPLRKSTNGWYDGTCPFCGEKKLAVSFDYLQVKCWRGCFNGFAAHFIMKVEGIKYFEVLDLIDGYPVMPLDFSHIPRYKNVEVSDIGLPVGFKSITQGKGQLGIRARRYLQEDRGFNIEYLDQIGVGYCNENDPDDDFFGYIIIPFKVHGKLSYFIGRDFIGNFPRYKNPNREKFKIGKAELFFNEEALYMQDKVYLTEGWTDAATMGEQGISVQGNSLSGLQKSKIITSPVEEVIIAIDAGFYRQGLRIARDLIQYKRVKVLNLDLLKPFGKDPNELGKDRIIELESITNQLGFKTLYKELKYGTRSCSTY